MPIDGSEWGQLEAQMEQQADQDEECWKDAAWQIGFRDRAKLPLICYGHPLRCV